MIKNTNQNYDSDSIVRSHKDYYLVVIDHKTVGLCTRFETAQACAKCFAQKYNAKEIDENDVYMYEDKDGRHLITIETVKRIRMPYSQED